MSPGSLLPPRGGTRVRRGEAKAAGAVKGSGASRPRLVVIDDQPLVRLGLQHGLGSEFHVCGEADTPHGAAAVLEKHAPQVALIEVALRDCDGVELIKSIRTQFPKVALVVFSSRGDCAMVERALRAGAVAYVTKWEPVADLIDAVHCAAKGELYLKQDVAAKVVRRLLEGRTNARIDGVDSLSDRESYVFQLLGTGHGSREISELMSISIKTVESHRENIKHKLGLGTASELVHSATCWVSEHLLPQSGREVSEIWEQSARRARR